MTSTARIPDVLRRFRLAAFAALVLAAAALAGCSEEGKTVQNTIPLTGIAYDVTKYESRVDTIKAGVVPTDTVIVVVMDVRLKLQTIYTNGCEARGGLELRVLDESGTRVYQVTALVRYTADEDCNVGLAGDTLQTITIKDLIIIRQVEDGFPDSVLFANMQAVGSVGPPIEFEIRHELATPGSDSTLYDIRVEDRDSGLPIDGALVNVQRYGTPNILGEGTTANGGLFSFSLLGTGDAGDDAERYVVKVSYAGRITLFEAIDFPSLSKRREAIVIRV